MLIKRGLSKEVLKILPVSVTKNIKTFKHNIETYIGNYYAQRMFSEKRLENLRCEILKYYSTPRKEIISTELSAAVDFLKHNPVNYFPCKLIREYRPEMVHLGLDQETKMNYALINGKRMFFKRGWADSKCINYCYCIQQEQDENSPHRYLSESFTVETGDIVVDVGAAEGIFSLNVIERASKIYLFEPDSSWNEALEATFAPWKEKVEIVNKYLFDKVSHERITVDSFFQNKKQPDFMKIDVDGEEAKVIKGCSQLLAVQEHLKIAICTYHKQEDESVFSKLLSEKGFYISFSKGFILFINDELSPPYFRRGVLQAVKRDDNKSS